MIEIPRWNYQWYRVCIICILAFYSSFVLYWKCLAWEQKLLHETIAKFKIFPLVYSNTLISSSSRNTTVFVQSSRWQCHKTMAPACSWSTSCWGESKRNTVWKSCRNGKRRADPLELQITSSQQPILYSCDSAFESSEELVKQTQKPWSQWRLEFI